LNITRTHIKNLGGDISFLSKEGSGTIFIFQYQKNMTKKISLIEDDETVRENTAEILELSNYQVNVAVNGKKGVEAARSVVPDIFVCDIMMPEMDGYEVLNELSHDLKTSGIPFIFLSAKTDHKDVRKGMNLGADDYLTKPFEEEELITAIESRIAKTEILEKSKPRR